MDSVSWRTVRIGGSIFSWMCDLKPKRHQGSLSRFPCSGSIAASPQYVTRISRPLAVSGTNAVMRWCSASYPVVTGAVSPPLSGETVAVLAGLVAP